MFRRKQDDDDPFAAIKDATERGSATVTTGNASAANSAGRDRGNIASTSVPGMPGGADAVGATGRRRSNGFLVFLVIVLSLGGAGAAVWASANNAPAGADGAQASDGSNDTSPGDGTATTSRGDAKPPPPGHYDLLRPATFKQALNGIERKLKPGERVWLVRLARDRINVDTRLRDGRLGLIDVNDELKITTTVAGEAGERNGLALAEIDPQAPSRAVRKASKQGGFPASKLDYLVLMAPNYPGDPGNWSLFFKDGVQHNSQWFASPDGGTVYRPGEQPGSGGGDDSLTIRTDSGTTTLTGADARRVTECVRRAGTNGSKIQECLP